MPSITKSEIGFKLAGSDRFFTVYHNLEEFNLDIEAALTNWVYRTDDYSEESFCKYVMSKDEQIVCIPQDQWKRLNEEK